MMPEPDRRGHARFIAAHTQIASPALLPEIRLYLATEMTPLWRLTARGLDEHDVPPPFWAFAWPGGQALARLVLDRPGLVRGQRVLDLGAGGGVAAIAAALAGAAQVVASDLDALAGAAIMLNAALNGATLTVTEADLVGSSDRAFDVILAGDLCYERAMAQSVIAWLGAQAAHGVSVLLGDPGRAYLPKGLRALATYSVPTSADIEDAPVKIASVYDLSQAASAASSTIV
jgi:predicted nicotinamide N-methyase